MFRIANSFYSGDYVKILITFNHLERVTAKYFENVEKLSNKI